MKLGAAPPADVVHPWRCVPVFETDAGACPVGTPDCCCERVSQDLDLVRAPRAACPYPVSGAEAGGGGGYRPSARRWDRRAQEDDLGRGPGARRCARPKPSSNPATTHPRPSAAPSASPKKEPCTPTSGSAATTGTWSCSLRSCCPHRPTPMRPDDTATSGHSEGGI